MAEFAEWVEWEADPGFVLMTDGRRIEVEPGDELFAELAEVDGENVVVFTDIRKRQVH